MTDSSEYKKIDWKDNTIEWKDIIKKEARGHEKGDDLGEVQEIGKEFVVTERGRVSKHKFYLPKQLVTGFDGHTLWFNIAEEDAEDNFKKDHPPKEGEYSRYQSASSTEQINNLTDGLSSDTTKYSLFDRLPLIEKQNKFNNPNVIGTTTNSIITDWDLIIHKGVRSKEMIAMGSVTAVNPTSIIITSDGAKDEFNVPKDEVEGYNGSELFLKPTLDRLEQYKVKVPR